MGGHGTWPINFPPLLAMSRAPGRRKQGWEPLIDEIKIAANLLLAYHTSWYICVPYGNNRIFDGNTVVYSILKSIRSKIRYFSIYLTVQSEVGSIGDVWT